MLDRYFSVDECESGRARYKSEWHTLWMKGDKLVRFKFRKMKRKKKESEMRIRQKYLDDAAVGGAGTWYYFSRSSWLITWVWRSTYTHRSLQAFYTYTWKKRCWVNPAQSISEERAEPWTVAKASRWPAHERNPSLDAPREPFVIGSIIGETKCAPLECKSRLPPVAPTTRFSRPRLPP